MPFDKWGGDGGSWGGGTSKKMRNQVMAKTGVYYSYKSKITLGKEPF